MRLAPFFVLATGCGVALTTTTINPAPRATTARDPATVEVYTAGPPPRPRVDVSLTWAELREPSTDPFIAFEEDTEEGQPCFLVARGRVVPSPDDLRHNESRWSLWIDEQGGSACRQARGRPNRRPTGRLRGANRVEARCRRLFAAVLG